MDEAAYLAMEQHMLAAHDAGQAAARQRLQRLDAARGQELAAAQRRNAQRMQLQRSAGQVRTELHRAQLNPSAAGICCWMRCNALNGIDIRYLLHVRTPTHATMSVCECDGTHR